MGGRERGTRPDDGAVVVTFTVNEPGEFGATFTLEGVTEQFPSADINVAHAHESARLPLKPADELTSSAYVAGCPGEIGALAACPVGELKQKSIAVPVSATVCGLLGALSERVKDAPLAVCVPHCAACLGVNAREMVHALPGGVFPDVHESFVMTKSLLFGPLTPTVVNASGLPVPLALFMTVTGCGGPAVPASRVPKPTLGGTETEGGAVALPASGTTNVCVAPPDRS